MSKHLKHLPNHIYDLIRFEREEEERNLRSKVNPSEGEKAFALRRAEKSQKFIFVVADVLTGCDTRQDGKKTIGEGERLR